MYDKRSFEMNQVSEERRNNRYLLSEYPPANSISWLMYPRTGENFNYTAVLSTKLIRYPSCNNFSSMIMARVHGLTREDSEEFLPSKESLLEGNRSICTIITHLKNLCDKRGGRYQAYVSHVEQMQSNANMNRPTYTATIDIPTPPSIVLRSSTYHPPNHPSVRPSSFQPSDRSLSNQPFVHQ